MKTVIEMAREAAAVHGHTFKAVPSSETIEFITAFAELVRADERNSWPAEMMAMERQVNILTDALAESRREIDAMIALARADEREACAKVCDELHWPWHMGDNSGPKECAAAIRARGNT